MKVIIVREKENPLNFARIIELEDELEHLAGEIANILFDKYSSEKEIEVIINDGFRNAVEEGFSNLSLKNQQEMFEGTFFDNSRERMADIISKLGGNPDDYKND